MGNSNSNNTSQEEGIFANELSLIKNIVNNIINDRDVFHNKDYNFLSQDICRQYNIVLQAELDKHLKIELESLGTKLYIIPKREDESLNKLKLSKKEICDKISGHYIKILYIICLIKHVYNLEKNGDLSIAGIVFRNIKIMDDIMEIDFCQVPQKSYKYDDSNSNSGNSKSITKINLGLVQGVAFFNKYFLKPTESKVFMNLMRIIFSRKQKKGFNNHICQLVKNKQLTAEEIIQIEELYTNRFGEKLVCTESPALRSNGFESPITSGSVSASASANDKLPNLYIEISENNPIFSNRMCLAGGQRVVKLNTPEGRKVHESYKKMKANYNKNIKNIHDILNKLTFKQGEEYMLKDIKNNELEEVINSVKTQVKIFYMQSILDYQTIFDISAELPNISIISNNKI
jgi:hypothetical protein